MVNHFREQLLEIEPPVTENVIHYALGLMEQVETVGLPVPEVRFDRHHSLTMHWESATREVTVYLQPDGPPLARTVIREADDSRLISVRNSSVVHSEDDFYRLMAWYLFTADTITH